jgi:predicted anti-sigma-YlaC factor YlaD
MQNESCITIRPLLVDYSDGALPADRAASIAAHLAACAACRAELRLLEDSLSLAREVWQENTSPRPLAGTTQWSGPGVRARKTPSRQKVLLAGGLTLCVTIVLVAIGFSLFSTGKTPPTARKSNSPLQPEVSVARANAAASKEKEIDVMEYIAREGRAARLAASMQMLATEPNLKQYKDNAERYLRENYADTTAVKMLGQQ